MSRYLLIAAGVVALALAGPAQAYGPRHFYGGARFNVYHGPTYLSTYGTRFRYGYYFRANNFYWNRRSWSSRYGCYCYWNPYASCWYYWYAPGYCYYPLSYIPYAPPPGVNVPPAGPVGNVSVPPPSGPAVP